MRILTKSIKQEEWDLVIEPGRSEKIIGKISGDTGSFFIYLAGEILKYAISKQLLVLHGVLFVRC